MYSCNLSDFPFQKAESGQVAVRVSLLESDQMLVLRQLKRVPLSGALVASALNREKSVSVLVTEVNLNHEHRDGSSHFDLPNWLASIENVNMVNLCVVADLF